MSYIEKKIVLKPPLCRQSISRLQLATYIYWSVCQSFTEIMAVLKDDILQVFRQFIFKNVVLKLVYDIPYM